MGEWKRNLLKKVMVIKPTAVFYYFGLFILFMVCFGLYNLCQKLLPMFLCSNANFQNESLMKLQFGPL